LHRDRFRQRKRITLRRSLILTFVISMITSFVASVVWTVNLMFLFAL
jgi:hypothetical protein